VWALREENYEAHVQRATLFEMTAIAAICRPGEIVIAADSRRLNLITSEQTSVCKIRDLRTVFAAVSGINTYAGTGYDISSFIPEQASEGNLSDIVDSIKRSVLPPLKTALEHLRANNPEAFKKYAMSNAPPLDIKFARVQSGEPMMINLSAEVLHQNNGPIVLVPKQSRYPGVNIFSALGRAFIGTPEGVAHQLSLPQNYSGDLIKDARNFVQMEIDKQVPEIGGPIDILQLTKDGSNWIQRKESCR
jgi:hypothetical protein